jgi:hypothetical protein
MRVAAVDQIASRGITKMPPNGEREHMRLIESLLLTDKAAVQRLQSLGRMSGAEKAYYDPGNRVRFVPCPQQRPSSTMCDATADGGFSRR